MAQQSNNVRKPTRREPGQNREEVRSRKSPVMIIVAIAIALMVAVGAYGIWLQVGVPHEEPVAEEQVPLTPEQQAELDHVNHLLDELTLEQKVAQLFVVRPEAITGVETAVAAGEATRNGILKYPVGGICYFNANLQDPKQTQEMLRNTQNYAKDTCGLPLFLCVDEEGGTVVRVADNEAFDVRNVGDMADVGATDDVERARTAAYEIGSYLSDLGFNVDFAPVADIVTSDTSVMAERSFGSDATKVSAMVAAQVEGFSRAGVLCAVKHFPGIGNAEGDSHNTSIYSTRTKDQFLSWELIPFEEAIKADVPMVMVSHLTCQSLGEDQSNLPASLSKSVMVGLLRDELGYDGIIITDSFEMGALDGVCTPDDQAVKAIQAGADIVLLPTDFGRAYEGLLRAVKQGTISEDRVDESVRRIIRAKLSLA